MKIVRAEHLGMCFGVRDAIRLAFRKATESPLTVLGELVHNESVLESLRNGGIEVEQRIESVSTPTVMITAHGASDSTISRARARGLNVLEATCPLVHFAHRAVQQLVRDGFHPVIVGKRDHVEVRGIVEDLEAYDIVLTDADVSCLREQPRFGVAAQTTQPIQKVRYLTSLIRQRFPDSEVRLMDTVCQPTKQRQSAAVELARQCDAVVVIGGANSNNTRELVATCASGCSRVFHVQSAGDLQPDWFAGLQVVGITAGTSTPDDLIDEVENRLIEIAASRNESTDDAEPMAISERLHESIHASANQLVHR